MRIVIVDYQVSLLETYKLVVRSVVLLLCIEILKYPLNRFCVPIALRQYITSSDKVNVQSFAAKRSTDHLDIETESLYQGLRISGSYELPSVLHWAVTW